MANLIGRICGMMDIGYSRSVTKENTTSSIEQDIIQAGKLLKLIYGQIL